MSTPPIRHMIAAANLLVELAMREDDYKVLVVTRIQEGYQKECRFWDEFILTRPEKIDLMNRSKVIWLRDRLRSHMMSEEEFWRWFAVKEQREQDCGGKESGA